MAFKKFRKMKVYEASGYNYKRTPSQTLVPFKDTTLLCIVILYNKNVEKSIVV